MQGEGAAVGHAPKLITVVEAAGDTLREESHLKSEVIFVGTSELQQWAEALPVQRRTVRLRLDLPALTDTERIGWQQQLERLHNDCGCSAAAVASVGAILLIAGYAILVGFDQPLWLVAIASMLGAIVALFAGKWLGRFRSRTKLRSDVGHLTQVIEHRATDEPRT